MGSAQVFTSIPTEVVLAFFTMCLGVLALIWRELKAIKNEFMQIKIDFAVFTGKEKGQNHEDRIKHLERTANFHHPGKDVRDATPF